MANDNRPRNSKGQFTTNNGTWFKNAAKSLGYAGYDMLKTSMPSVMDTIDINREFATDLMDTLRKAKNSRGKFNIKQTLSGKALENWNDIEEIARNAKADLKSGQFYNKQRKIRDEFGLDDFDFDDDFSFDMSDDLDDSNFDDDVKVVVPNVTINSNIDKNNPMVQAVQQQTRLLADNEANNTKRSIAIAESQMKLDKQLASVLYGGMETINSNLSTLIRFNNEHTSGYIGASLKYYEENIRYMSEISETLKQIGGFMTKKEESPRRDNPIDQIFDMGSGAFNLSEYTKIIKKQLRNTIDEDMMMGTIMTMFEGDGLKAFIQSPLTFLPQLVLAKMVPEFLTNTFKTFDKSFKSFMPALLNKMGSWADEMSFDVFGEFKRLVGSIFGINNSGKTTIDTSKYEKGSIPFDGVTKKSIVEVIPGYLSKILSALTGKDELIFDSDRGKFITKTNLKKEYEDNLRRATLTQYESRDELKSRTSVYGKEKGKELEKYIDDLLFALAQRKKSFNPHMRDDGSDDIAELLKGVSSEDRERVRSLILSLNNGQQMELAGSGHVNARRALTRQLEELEKSGNLLGTSQFNNLFSDEADYLKDNPLIKGFTSYSNNSKTGKSVGSIFTPSDRYGKNSLDYLHDIYKTLLEGIGVWQIEPVRNRLDNFNTYKSENDVGISRYAENHVTSELSPAQIKYNEEHGIIPDMTGSIEYQVEKITQHLNMREKTPDAKQKGNIFTNIFKYIFGSKDTKQQITHDMFSKLGGIFSNVFHKLDEGMYKIVFGEKSIGNADTKKGLLSTLGGNIKLWLFGEKDAEGKSIGGIFNRFHTFLTDNIFNPIKDAFIGDNGIITKFKQSEFYKRIVNSIKKTGVTLFGEKGEDGKRSGGKFSEWYNSGIDYVSSVKGEIKTIGSNFKDNLKEWLFGTDPDNTKKDAKGLLSDVTDYFKQGLQGFTDLIFGQNANKDIRERENDIKFDDIFAKIKERSPKMFASGIVGGGLGALAGAGGFGILGSLFLGPMSGVVIGAASGFLSQSETFKNWLFGEKDDNGDRIGGFISKSTQNFFKEHKGAIIGGSALGALKGITGIGFLPSFILGGPITGALFGLGTSLITRSKMFQDMLFGKQDEHGDRSGGIIGKVTGKINDENIKKSLGFAGAGAGLGAITGTALSSFGILGSIAFGPLSGAILGAGAGIAMAANKWKDAIFGKFDEKTGKRTELGILSKMMTAVSVEVLQPAKVQITEWKYNVQDWFAEHIAEPFIDSIEPLKEEVKRFKDRVLDFTTSVLDKLHITDAFEGINQGIKNGFTEIGKFMTKISKSAIEGIGKFTGFVVSSPFKLINLVADKILLPKHMREGIKAVRDKIIDNIKESNFVKSVNTHVIEPIKGTILEVRDFTKNIISNMFSWIWTGIKKIGVGIVNGITAPFKGIAAIGKGIGSLINKGTTAGSRDTGRLYDILINTGERGFGQSVGDLLSLANPFSSLRRAAKNYNDGADYQDKRLSAREQRKLEREATRKQHKQQIKEMRAVVRSKRRTARELGYNVMDDDTSITDEMLNRIIDKEFSSEYGKEYKNKSKIEKDTFKETKAVNKSIFDIKGLVTTLVDVVKNKGIKVHNADLEPKDSLGVTPNIDNADKDNKALEVLTGASNNTEKKSTKHRKGSYAKSIEEKKAEEARLKEQGLFHKIANLLEIGNKDRKEHSTVWSSIFSKKGLITGGLLLLAPLLYKFLKDGLNINISNMINNGITRAIDAGKEFFGFSDKDGSRTNSVGDTQTNDDAIEAANMGAVKLGVTAIHRVAKANELIGNAGRTAGKFLRNNTDDVGRTAGRYLRNNADDISRTAGKYLRTNTDDVGRTVGRYLRNNADDAMQTTQGIIKKFVSLLDDGTEKLIKWLTKKFPNFAKNKIGAKVISVLKGIIKLPGKLISFTDDILKGFNKIAASTTTAYILDAGFVIYGGVTGATKTETANLFGVSQDAVNSKMQQASGLLKALLSFSWFFVISLASDISVAMGGPDIVRLIAQTLYSLLVNGDSDKIDQLMNAQTEFTEDYNQYIGVQEYLKGNAQLTTDENGNQTFVITDPSRAESMDSYNDRVNKSIFGRGMSWIGDKFTSARTFFTGQKGDSKAHEEAQNQLIELDRMVEQGLIDPNSSVYIETRKSIEKRLSETESRTGLFNRIRDKAIDIFAPIVDTISPYFNAGKELLTFIKDTVVISLKQAFDSDTDTDKINIDDDDPLRSIKRVLFYGIKTVLLPTYMSLKLVDMAWEKVIKPVGEGIMNLGRAFVQDSASMVTSIKKGDGIFTKSYWTAPDTNDNTTSGLRKVGFYAQRMLSAPAGLIGTVGKYAWDKVIKPAGEGVMNLGKAFVQDSASMANSIKKGDGIFTKSYWTAPNDNDNTTSGLRKVGFYTQRMLSAPAGLIGTVGKYAWDKVIKPAGEGVMNLGKVFVQDSNSMYNSIKNGDGIFTKSYWTAPNTNDNTTSGLRKVGFYAQRIMTIPAGLIGTVSNSAVDIISKLWSSITSFSSYMKTVINTQNLTTENYWTANKPTGTNIMDSLKKVLFYVGRGIMAPAFYLENALTLIGDKVKSAFGSVGQWFSDLFDLDKYFGKGGAVVDDPAKYGGVGGSNEMDMIGKYTVTSHYQPSRTINGVTSAHRGIDLYSGSNNPVRSFTSGTVDYVSSGYAPDSGKYGSTDGGGFGNWVRVRDPYGNYNCYAHMNGVNVRVGQSVLQGDQLGIEGHTGSSTGTHLHYEVRKGGTSGAYAVNPLTYLENYIETVTSHNNSNQNNNSSNSNVEIVPDTTINDKPTGLMGVATELTNAFTNLISPITSLTSSVTDAFTQMLGITTPSNQSSSGANVTINNGTNNSQPNSSTTVSPGTISTSGDAATIWKTLRSLGFSKIATAALMGNFDAESALKSNNLQDTYESILGFNDNSYTTAVDNGSYSLDRFMNDAAGYGLAQWTYNTRKQNLYNFAKSKGTSIADLGMQLGFVANELGSSGINRLNSFNDITSASTHVMKNYENPRDQSQSAINTRASFSQTYFDRLSGLGGAVTDNPTISTGPYNRFRPSNFNHNIIPNNISKILQNKNVSNINSSVIEYLKKIADGIMSIVTNTGDTNTKLEEIKIIESEKNDNTNIAVVKSDDNKSNSPMYDIASNRRAHTRNRGYQTAKAIAGGGI